MPKAKNTKVVNVVHKPHRGTKSVLSVLLFAGGFATSYVAMLAQVTPHHLLCIANGSAAASEDVMKRIARVFDLQTSSPSKLLEPVSTHKLTEVLRAYLGVD